MCSRDPGLVGSYTNKTEENVKFSIKLQLSTISRVEEGGGKEIVYL